MYGRIMFPAAVALVSLVPLHVDADESSWRFESLVDRVSNVSKGYVIARSVNPIADRAGKEYVYLLVSCYGSIQMESPTLDYRIHQTDCSSRYSCDRLQFGHVSIDKGDRVMFAFTVFDPQTLGFRYFRQEEKVAELPAQMLKGQMLRLEFSINIPATFPPEEADLWKRVAEFSLSGFEAAARQCPIESALHRIVSEDGADLSFTSN